MAIKELLGPYVQVHESVRSEERCLVSRANCGRFDHDGWRGYMEGGGTTARHHEGRVR